MPSMSDLNRFQVAQTNIDNRRSIFPRNHSVKLSFDLGDVVPFLCEEILPGDSWSVDTSKVIRTQPLVTPVMDNIDLDTYFFFVPNRLVWTHWINFMGENSDSAWIPEVEYSVPQLTIPDGGFAVGTIADYMGVPPLSGAGFNINALPFRAYALICDQWFRDENLMDPVNIELGDSTIVGSNGDNQITDIVKGGKPFIAAKRHDMFTSALPAPQKSLNPVSVPISLASTYSAKVPVITDVDSSYALTMTEGIHFHTPQHTTVHGPVGLGVDNGQSAYYTESAMPSSTTVIPSNLWVNMEGSMLDGIGFSINDFRFAYAMQRYYEAIARSGSRYIESIKAFYGVTSPDARMQRAEFLSGSRVPINISQVENVTNTSQNIEPIGSVAGISVTGNAQSEFSKSFTEHGYIIGVMVARLNSHSYQQGLEPTFFRKTLFDYYNPVFSNIGEQPIDIRSIYIDAYTPDDPLAPNTFGYQEAWADYRFKNNRISGELRSVYDQSLDVWHFGDYYASRPYLSASWIREDKSLLDRALAVTSDVSNQFIADIYIKSNVARCMPTYSIPGLSDKL